MQRDLERPPGRRDPHRRNFIECRKASVFAFQLYRCIVLSRHRYALARYARHRYGCGNWLRIGEMVTDLITVHRTHDGSPLLLNRDHVVWAEDTPDGSNVRLVTGETIGIKEPITQLKNK